jgi:orotidine-5'-phosphate decarboxylase
MERAAKDKIIIALDVDSLERARELVALLHSATGAFKIGKQLFTRYGPQAIAMVHDAGGAVFLDLKFHDIPNTVARASAEVVRHGVLMLNMHAMGGFEMMRQTVAEVHRTAESLHVRRPLVLAVTVLTSLGQSDLVATGISSGVEEQVRRLAQLARSAGVDGVVASPQEIEMIKTACGTEFLVVTPGVRPKAAAADDQKRILSPGEAIRKGADYIVVGRPVIEAPDPLAAVREIINDIRQETTDNRHQTRDNR